MMLKISSVGSAEIKKNAFYYLINSDVSDVITTAITVILSLAAGSFTA